MSEDYPRRPVRPPAAPQCADPRGHLPRVELTAEDRAILATWTKSDRWLTDDTQTDTDNA